MSQVNFPRRVAIVGSGRCGRALAASLLQAGHELTGPLGRDYAAADLLGVEVVLLCVPDREIAVAAATLAERLEHVASQPLVGHCSGAGTLAALAPLPQRLRFSLHPLMTIGEHDSAALQGCFAAVAGASDDGLAAAVALALSAGMTPFEIDEDDRAAYHAAASIASNFLVALECAAERLAESTGVDRAALVPLVRATIENWAAAGGGALTGPIARGDEATVRRQRDAVAERTPELLELFDCLAGRTRTLAAEAVPA